MDKINSNFMVTEQEIHDWLDREVPHLSSNKNKMDYYVKYWNIEEKIIRAKYKGEL